MFGRTLTRPRIFVKRFAKGPPRSSRTLIPTAHRPRPHDDPQADSDDEHQPEKHRRRTLQSASQLHPEHARNGGERKEEGGQHVQPVRRANRLLTQLRLLLRFSRDSVVESVLRVGVKQFKIPVQIRCPVPEIDQVSILRHCFPRRLKRRMHVPRRTHQGRRRLQDPEVISRRPRLLVGVIERILGFSINLQVLDQRSNPGTRFTRLPLTGGIPPEHNTLPLGGIRRRRLVQHEKQMALRKHRTLLARAAGAEPGGNLRRNLPRGWKSHGPIVPCFVSVGKHRIYLARGGRGLSNRLLSMRALLPQTSLLAGLLMLAFFAVTEVGAAADFVRIESGTSVPSVWSADHHLYVKGDIGVSEERLQELEEWIRQNAPNWTIVLLDTAADAQFQDAEGNRYTEMDAVEHALGKGLPNQTPFGALTDQRTGQANGQFFVLFLKERKFSYFASEAYDSRQLGEAQWQGRLDQPAIQAMRSGGRIVDAVKDTITSIDRQLTGRIENEAADRERRKAERAALEKEAATAIQSAEDAVTRLEKLHQTVFAANQSASGDLARMDFAGRRVTLAEARAQPDPQSALNTARRVESSARQDLAQLQQYAAASEIFDRIKDSITDTSRHPRAGAATESLAAARQALADGRVAHANGDSRFLTELQIARQNLGYAHQSIVRAEAFARRNRQLAIALGAILILGLAVVGLLANRRRRHVKREAADLLETWQRGLHEKTDALLALLQRTQIAVGSAATLERRGLKGKTQELCRQIISDVDELFIMSGSVNGVFNRAQQLAEPGGIGGRIVNLFHGTRYRRAIHLLKEEPIRFSPDDGILPILRESRTPRESLLGNLESYKPFELSFPDLVEKFNRLAARALDALDTVENSWPTIQSEQDRLQGLLDRTREREKALQAPDGLFWAPALFADLVPAAQRDLDEATALGVSDPVRALDEKAPVARRQAEEADALSSALVEFRAEILPDVQLHIPVLETAGFRTGWIAAELQALSERANEIAREALARSTAEDIAGWKTAARALAERTSRAETQSNTVRKTSATAIERAVEETAKARREIAAALNLPETAVLHEEKFNPDDCIRRAREQLAAAEAALDRGDVDDADRAITAVEDLAGEALALLSATREALNKHEQLVSEHDTTLKRLQDDLPKKADLLAQMCAGYAPSALRAHADDTKEGKTIAEHAETAAARLADAGESLQKGRAAHRSGNLLEAQLLLDRCGAMLGDATILLAEIAFHHTLLGETERSNAARFEEAEARRASMRTSMEDPKTMRPTLEGFDDSGRLLFRAREQSRATPADPFTVQESLGKLGESLDRIADQARCDADLYEEAKRSIVAARTQLTTALELARTARNDQIPDSRTISESYDLLEAFEADLTKLEDRLQAPHEDWSELDREADRVAVGSGQTAARLRGELANAKSAISALTASADAVRHATRWTGTHGVNIAGSPGAHSLEQAREALRIGAYIDAAQLAESARQTANDAVRTAELQVARLRRAAEERAAAERRRRAAEEASRHSSMFGNRSGGSSFGRSSSFGSSSSGRSSSSTSRSSFSSGSGTSRSGW